MIQLTQKEYDDLVADRNKLWALEACGVDNWDGFDIAMESLEDDGEEDFLSGATCNPDAPEECESCQ